MPYESTRDPELDEQVREVNEFYDVSCSGQSDKESGPSHLARSRSVRELESYVDRRNAPNQLSGWRD